LLANANTNRREERIKIGGIVMLTRTHARLAVLVALFALLPVTAAEEEGEELDDPHQLFLTAQETIKGLFEEYGRLLDEEFTAEDESLLTQWQAIGQVRSATWDVYLINATAIIKARAEIEGLQESQEEFDAARKEEQVWWDLHRKFLQELVHGQGYQLAAWKSDFNDQQAGLESLSECNGPVLRELMKTLESAEGHMDEVRRILASAKTEAEVNRAKARLNIARIPIIKVKRVLVDKAKLAREYLEGCDPEDLDKRLTDIETAWQGKEFWSDPLLEKDWKFFVEFRIASLKGDIVTYEDLYALCFGLVSSLETGAFYKVSSSFKGDSFKELDPPRLMEPVDALKVEVEAKLEEVRKKSTLVDEIKNVADWAARQRDKLLSRSKSPVTEQYDRIKALITDAPPEAKAALQKILDSISPEKEQTILQRLADAMKEVDGESVDGLLRDATGALLDADARDRLKSRFQRLLGAQEKSLAQLQRALKEFEYLRRTAWEEAQKILKAAKARSER
jgi:hypothetical protein